MTVGASIAPPFFRGVWLEPGHPDNDAACSTSAIYGDRFERLRSLKRRWDPDNVFRGSHNVPPGEDHDITQLQEGA